MLFIVILLLFFLLVAGVIGGVLVYVALRSQKLARAIENAPLRTAQKLRAGPAKMKGKVVALEAPLTSPLTRSACVYYHFLVEQQHTTRTGGKNPTTSTYWTTVVDDRRHVVCALDDHTGRAELDLDGAEVVMTTEERSRSGFLNDAPKRLQRLMEDRYSVSTKGLLFNKNLRYSESVIEEGDDLFVLGTVEKEEGEAPVFVKARSYPLIVSDKNESALVWRYRTTALWCWIGTGVVGVIFFVIVLVILVNGLRH
jgi:hypothetical protein